MLLVFLGVSRFALLPFSQPLHKIKRSNIDFFSVTSKHKKTDLRVLKYNGSDKPMISHVSRNFFELTRKLCYSKDDRAMRAI